MQGVRKGGKFPSPEVRRQKQDSLSPGVGTLVVFQPVIHHDLIDILRRVFRELAQFGELPAQRRKNSPQNALALGHAFLGKHHCEIAHPHLPQAEVQQINKLGDADGESPRKGARHQTQDLDERPGCRVFEFPPHRGKRDRITRKNCLSNSR